MVLFGIEQSSPLNSILRDVEQEYKVDGYNEEADIRKALCHARRRGITYVLGS